jgi:hypothetical protein
MTTESAGAGKTDYEIGYRKPPKATQFQPGRSGNPWGRSKESKNSGTMLQHALNETVLVTDGGIERRITRREAFFKTLVARGLKEPRFAALLMKAVERHEPVTANDPIHRIEVSFVEPRSSGGG